MNCYRWRARFRKRNHANAGRPGGITGAIILLLLVAGLASAQTPLTITPPALVAGSLGRQLSTQLEASGGMGGYTWEIYSGSIGGLALDSAGNLSGYPTTAAKVEITVQVTDLFGYTAQAELIVDIKKAFVLPLATVGELYSWLLSLL